MSLPISSIVPIAASAPADAGETGLVFRPGTVVDARVLQVEANGLAKILISGAVIDALSEAQLSAGANLRLAVSTSPEGVRLTIVPQDAKSAVVQGTQAQPTAGTGAANATADAGGTQQVVRPAGPGAPPSPEAAARAALTQAVANAAARQTSLSPLFANLTAALGQGSLPPQVAQAALALLALRPPLDAKLSGEDVRRAAQRSGTFLEGKLAAGQPVGGGAPDLKAALTGLRRALIATFGEPGSDVAKGGSAGAPAPAATTSARSAPASAPHGSPAATGTTARVASSVSSSSLPAASPSGALAPHPQAVRPANQPATGTGRSNALPTNEAAPAVRPSTAMQSNGDVLIPVRIVAASAAQAALPSRTGLGALIALIAEAFEARPDTVAQRAAVMASGDAQPSTPPKEPPVPPPMRGQAPSAQPVAAPSLAPDAGAEEIGRVLFRDTEGALARQVLLQAASLADRPEGPGPRAETMPTRLQFEIPFATAQGTAMAHFEIAEDGGGTGAAGVSEGGWQARFSLTTDAAGPVHVLVTLAGGRTSVRMWAERSETAALLRGNDASLTEQLSRAALAPGNISIAEGVPPRRRPAAAGHFLDRAT